MKYRKLSNLNDYQLGVFTTDVEAVVQALRTRLLLFQGEWWENSSLGLPLFQQILGAGTAEQQLSAIDLIVQNQILETQGVTEILTFSSQFENRVYSAQITVNTIYGVVTLEV